MFRVVEHSRISAARDGLERLHFAFRDMDRLISLLLDAETGQRGYLLTGSPQYLEPYNAADRELPDVLAQFQESSQATRLRRPEPDRLVSEALQKMDELRTTVHLRKSKGEDAAMAAVSTNRGNDLMAAARANAKSLREAYFAAILRDLSQIETGNRNALAVSIFGNVSTVLLLILVSFRLRNAFAEIKQLVSRLSAGEESYQLLVRRCESVREEERASLAREIHDALGGALTSIKFGMAQARKNAQECGASKAVSQLQTASTEVDQTIRALRRIASALRPPLLDHAGLVPALQSYAGEFTQRTGIRIEQHFPPRSVKLPPDQAIGMYRVVQEALTNVVRHSQATGVELSIAIEGEYLRLYIRDNGVGFAKNEMRKHSLGLLGMKERAKLAGGELTVESTPGKGTMVSVAIALVLDQNITLSGASANSAQIIH